MTKKIESYPVAPGSVYVWRGYMAPPPRTYQDFISFLGGVFVPACALLQPTVGLRAYITSFIPQENKPSAVPDQSALMFWDTPASHNLANGTVAVRIYQNLHGDVYDMTKSSLPEVPVAFPAVAGDFKIEQPYFLFDNPADWMLGQPHHVVGARKSSVSQEDFISSMYNWASQFKSSAVDGVDAALICCGNDYAVAWVHGSDDVNNFSSILNGFATLLDVQLDIAPRSMSLPAGLWNKWAGLDLTQAENTSLNVQLQRSHDTIPVI